MSDHDSAINSEARPLSGDAPAPRREARTDAVPRLGPAKRRESRDELVARVRGEQASLHPAPHYGARSIRRLRRYLVAILPLGMLLGWLGGVAFGWNLLEWLGAGVGLVVGLAYFGYVLVTERDDGRIQDEVRRLVADREAAD